MLVNLDSGFHDVFDCVWSCVAPCTGVCFSIVQFCYGIVSFDWTDDGTQRSDQASACFLSLPVRVGIFICICVVYVMSISDFYHDAASPSFMGRNRLGICVLLYTIFLHIFCEYIFRYNIFLFLFLYIDISCMNKYLLVFLDIVTVFFSYFWGWDTGESILNFLSLPSIRFITFFANCRGCGSGVILLPPPSTGWELQKVFEMKCLKSIIGVNRSGKIKNKLID